MHARAMGLKRLAPGGALATHRSAAKCRHDGHDTGPPGQAKMGEGVRFPQARAVGAWMEVEGESGGGGG